VHNLDSLRQIVESIDRDTAALHQSNKVSTISLQSTESYQHFIIVDRLFQTPMQPHTQCVRKMTAFHCRHLSSITHAHSASKFLHKSIKLLHKIYKQSSTVGLNATSMTERVSSIYVKSQKTCHLTYVHMFTKYWLIFAIKWSLNIPT